jgi:hypothetical protein
MQGDDGVVKYSSAHIEPVESELVVNSSHSTQDNPHTIEEVRRILRLNAGLRTGAGPSVLAEGLRHVAPPRPAPGHRRP